MMHRSLVFAIALVLFVSFDAGAQHRVESPWLAAEFGTHRALVPSEPRQPAAQPGMVGATVGATAGMVLSLPLFLVGAMGASCQPWGEEESCYTAFLPLLVGTAAGASLGASLDGGDPAIGSTLLGALVGTSVGAYVIMSRQETSGWSGMLMLTVPPTAGAVIGNRLGQRGR